MKRSIIFLMIALLVCSSLFASCGVLSENPSDSSADNESITADGSQNGISSEISDESFESSETDVSAGEPLKENEIESTHKFFEQAYDYTEYERYSLNKVFNPDAEAEVLVIRSVAARDALVGKLDENSEFALYLNSLPEDYFSQKVLLVNDFTIGHIGSTRIYGGTFVKDGVLTVNYTCSTPEGVVLAMAIENCFAVVEVDIADIEGVQEFRATRTDITVYE